MKRIALMSVFLASALIPALAQKIEDETGDRTRIVHLKTALNHLTVIEVAEPVVEVAAGSPSFKVEWRENKVFVQPTEADEATNLFIWTANQRLNYELEPAGAVRDMDFAVDQKYVEPVKPASVTPPASASMIEPLLAGKPVRLLPSKPHDGNSVEVWISDLYEKDDRLLVRYAVRNHTNEPYTVNTPAVYQLTGIHSPQSLYGLINSQLGDEQAAKLKPRQQVLVKVFGGRMQPTPLAPGEEGVGVVAFDAASSNSPSILRFQFPSPKPSGDKQSERRLPQVEAFLVR